MIDLRPDHLKIVQRILRKHVPETLVWAFGSRVTWTAKAHSDLDLALITEKPLDPKTFSALKEAFSGSDLPVRVDLVDWAETTEEFREVIRKKYEVVQADTRGGKGRPLTALGEIAEIVCGGTPSTAISQYWEPGEVDWVTAKDISESAGAKIWLTERKISKVGLENSAAKLLPPLTTVLIARGATMGKCRMTGREMALNQTCYGIIAKPNADPRYVYYFLSNQYDRFRAMAHGSVFDTVIGSGLRSFQVPAPSIEEQRAIAHILGTLDDKIQLNQRMNETLEAMARSLFKSWFVDFDPVRARAEDRDTGLPKEVADLFPDSFEESELGEVPEGWHVKSVGDLAEVVGGTTPSTKERSYWDGGTHGWATPKDLSGLSVPVLLDTERHITDAGLSQVGSGLLPRGTVLLSSRAPIGYLAVAEIPVAINQGFIAMTPKMGISNLFLLLWASIAHEDIVSRANGSTFLEISKANFRPIPVVTPPIDIMKEFDHLAQPLYKRMVECVREARALAALRDSLLPKLLSGEVPVKNMGFIT